MSLSQLQCAILLGMGLQAKNLDDISKETTLPAPAPRNVQQECSKIARRMRRIFEDAAADEIDQSLAAAKAKSTEKNKRRSKLVG